MRCSLSVKVSYSSPFVDLLKSCLQCQAEDWGMQPFIPMTLVKLYLILPQGVVLILFCLLKCHASNEVLFAARFTFDAAR
jgi:hypothetical protein